MCGRPTRGGTYCCDAPSGQLQWIDGKMKLAQGVFKLLLVSHHHNHHLGGSSQRAALAFSVSGDTVLIRLFWACT